MTDGRNQNVGWIVRNLLPLLAALLAGALPLLLEHTSMPLGARHSEAGAEGIVVTASLDSPQPERYSTVTVLARVTDRWQRPLRGATVTATAHFRTTTTVHSAVTDETGTVELLFRISAATPGFQVPVQVVAVRDGRTDSTEVSFTPRKRE